MTFVQCSGHFLYVSRIEKITTYIDLSQRKFVHHFGTQRFHCLPSSSADSDSSNARVPAFSTSHQPLIMDSIWSLLAAVGSQSAMSVSANSTWSSATASTEPQTPVASPACTSDLDCGSLICSPGQQAVCVGIGLGLHAYRQCQCTASVETGSPLTETELPGPGSSESPGTCSANSDCSSIGCPSDEEVSCVGYGLGEHAYSSCGCVTPPRLPTPSSSLPPLSLPSPSPPSPSEAPVLPDPEVSPQVPMTPPALSGCTIWEGLSGTSGTCV